MAQYAKVKNDHPDTILLFRVGDFFETFEDDAKTASKVLGITLTKRANGKADSVPLAGFPHHAIDTYLPKLVRAGYRVAICEQVENPKFAKGIVKRDVVEVVTPGVAFSEKILDHKKNNYLLAVHFQGEVVGLSFTDISTGEFYTYEALESNLLQQLEHINPAEVLIAKMHRTKFEDLIKKTNFAGSITRIDDWIFDYDFSKDLIQNHFGIKTLKGFGIENYSSATIAAGCVLNYLKETQKANL
jgi:DNA mismatch repair protein MutS